MRLTSDASPGVDLRTQRFAAALAAVATAVLPAAAAAGEFMDTRLTFLFTDEDVLHGAGETTPSSPAPRIGGGRSSTLFFDNYETKYTGFETLTNLVLYKKDRSFFQNVETEGAVHILFFTESTRPVSDASSYLRLTWRDPTWKPSEGVSLTAFPISADRFRLGYSYRLSWGGNPIFPRAGSTPGVKLQFTRGPVYAFLGLKTAQLLNDETSEVETNYGALAGAGWDILDTLRWEVGGGLFQRGVIPKDELLGEPTTALGASTQLTFHVGMPVGTSVDFKLYKNDPELYEQFFKPEDYPGGVSFSVSAEGTYLVQTLQDSGNVASTVRQPATAADLQAKVKIDKTRIHATGSYRDLAFVLFNVPSLVPYQDFPEDADITPELFVAAGADYFFESIHLTPGIVGGVQFPASITTETVFELPNSSETVRGVRTVVVRDEGRFDILPADDEAVPIYSVKGTARLDISESMAAVGEVFYNLDGNRATIADNETEGGNQPVRVFEDPDQLGFNVLLQARF